MAWVNDDGEHEGWAAAEFADGRISGGSGSGGVTTYRFGPGGLDLASKRTGVDGRAAIGWRAVCDPCGWRGPLWQRAADPREHDPSARLIWQAGPDQYADPPAEVEEALHAEWRAHLPSRALAAIREITAEIGALQARLAGLAGTARAEGATWSEIGAAAGITRQSAHERWAVPQ